MDHTVDGVIFRGIVCVTESKSERPTVAENRELEYVTGIVSGKFEHCIAIAKLDPTFLMADVEVVVTHDPTKAGFVQSQVNGPTLSKSHHILFFRPCSQGDKQNGYIRILKLCSKNH